jgi:hypothetical protein
MTRSWRLSFAVKDSHEDRFAQQLEPALSHLAVDIRSGFNYLGGCIHKWSFSVPAKGINLEQDIADLEARMDEVRHTGVAFASRDSARLRCATALEADCAASPRYAH